MKKLILLVIAIVSLSSCSLFEEPEFNIDPKLAPYVEQFYKEAEIRGIFIQRNNLIAKLRDMDINGASKKHSLNGQKKIYINRNFVYSYSENYSQQIEIIVFHEMGHALLKKNHSDEYRGDVMNTSPCINCYEGNGVERKIILDRFFN